MHPWVATQLRVKRGDQMLALLNKDRVTLIFREHPDARSGTADDGGADENCFHPALSGSF